MGRIVSSLLLAIGWVGMMVAVFSVDVRAAINIPPFPLSWVLDTLVLFAVLSMPWVIRPLWAFSDAGPRFSWKRYPQALGLGAAWLLINGGLSILVGFINLWHHEYISAVPDHWVPPYVGLIIWSLSCGLYIAVLHRRLLVGAALVLWLVAYHYWLTPTLHAVAHAMSFSYAVDFVFGTATGLSIAVFDIAGMLLTPSPAVARQILHSNHPPG